MRAGISDCTGTCTIGAKTYETSEDRRVANDEQVFTHTLKLEDDGFETD